MSIVLLFRSILQFVWGGLGILFLGNAVYLLLNYFFQWRPDKVSISLSGSLEASGCSLLFGLMGAMLFIGLAARRQWLFRAYWVSFAVTVLWLLQDVFSIKDALSTFSIGALLALIGILIQLKREWFGFKNAP